jgi:hypothetical protein
MIAAETVAEIRRLLDEDRLSQREIARRTGVCRGSVGAIASGHRPGYESQPDPPDDGLEEPTGPPARCPGCGAKVYLPCALCHVRSEIGKRPRGRAGDRQDDAFVSADLDLRLEHRVRYDEVREARRAATTSVPTS